MSADVLIVGGGPAGSTCGWVLRRAGLDVLVLDTATFPRDKVCAGWITPQVVTELQLDLDEYGSGRTLQAITGFRTGTIGSDRAVETAYGHPVSYGIRRCEFDHYLLQRSRARLELRTPIESLKRDGEGWIVNGRIRSRMLVGAGGHFCPVARWLNGRIRETSAPLVVAQEAEFSIEGDPSYATRPEQPELYFCRDLKGYGWCFRKGQFVNVGLGRLDAHSLPQASREFVDFLKATERIPRAASWRWRGHAYLLQQSPRRLIDDGVVLIGDAAGLAYAESGEGIRPAIESGLLAAATIVDARERYSRAALESYGHRLRARFGGPQRKSVAQFGALGQQLMLATARRLLGVPWFVRSVVLDRWFLHANQAALAT